MRSDRGRDERLRERSAYQREVARLLERIDAQTHRLRRLEAAGARTAALAALARETERTREQLAELIARRRTPAGPAARPPAMSLRAPRRPTSVRDPRTEGAAA